jgi:hypothetical protein
VLMCWITCGVLYCDSGLEEGKCREGEERSDDERLALSLKKPGAWLRKRDDEETIVGDF